MLWLFFSFDSNMMWKRPAKTCWLVGLRGFMRRSVLSKTLHWTLLADLPVPKRWESRHNIIQQAPLHIAYSSLRQGDTKILSNNRCQLAALAFLTLGSNLTAWPDITHQPTIGHFEYNSFSSACFKTTRTLFSWWHVCCTYVYSIYIIEIWSANVLAALENSCLQSNGGEVNGGKLWAVGKCVGGE